MYLIRHKVSDLVPEENIKPNLNAEIAESKSYFDGGRIGTSWH